MAGRCLAELAEDTALQTVTSDRVIVVVADAWTRVVNKSAKDGTGDAVGGQDCALVALTGASETDIGACVVVVW